MFVFFRTADVYIWCKILVNVFNRFTRINVLSCSKNQQIQYGRVGKAYH
jgi:hypothetical protein